MNMTNIFEVGDEITGFCNGCFGDDYENGSAAVLNYVEWLSEVVGEWR